MKEADWDLVVDINLKGVFNVMQGFVSLLLKSKASSVINMASVVGVDGNLGQTNYAATKGGVIAMSKTWAKEFGRKNLRSNALAPGFIKTDMTHVLPEKVVEKVLDNTPLRKMGDAEDVANAALFLASDNSKFITGQVLRIDGGLNL
jgi:short-chain dehydrogenase/reductase SDR